MRIFCIGRNYQAHIEELNNERPDEPVVFLKPSSCLVEPSAPIPFPSHGSDLHHEAEIVVEIGRRCRQIPETQAPEVISKLGLGLDLTLRDVQNQLRAKDQPWEKSKAFDHSSPLGPMQAFSGQALDDLHIACEVNGVVRQEGNSKLMIFSIPQIISYLSSIWELHEGDLIYTGTPSGVASLNVGDSIRIYSEQLGEAKWDIAPSHS